VTTALIVSNLLLWVTVVGLALVVLALTRQIGVLHERVSPAGALVVGGGPKAGEQAPVIDVVTIDGAPLRIGAAAARATLLLFVSPTCPVCKTLLPVVRSVARAETEPLDIVLASDGVEEEHREFLAREGIGDLPYVLSTLLGRTWQVGKLPYAVLLDADGVLRARGLVNSREHLESLFEAWREGVGSIQDWMERRRTEAA
jgi:methylamine dehydrogenase accessory protein MauD